MHEMMKNIDVKIDQFADKMDKAIEKAFDLEIRISNLEIQRTERWKVQGWYNRFIIGSIATVFLALGYEWFQLHGGK